MKFQKSRLDVIIKPTPCDNKLGWYETHDHHVCLMNRMKPSFLLIGDSIIYGLSRYKNVWIKYFSFSKTVNCGIPGDKTQNVLWRAENLVIPSSVKFLIVHCGTNNLDYDDPNCIAKGILNISKSLLNKAPTSNILLTGLLPRDKCNSNRRKRLKKVNSHLLSLCKNENNMLYMDQGRGWTLDDHTLDESLYYVDQLHLIEAGNAKFASSISNTIHNFNDLKFKLQSSMPMLISHTKSVLVTSSETSLPLSMPPTSHKSPPSIHKPPPSTLPRKQPPSISFHKPPPSTSPRKPRPSTSPHKPPSSTSPQKPPPSTSPLKPRPSTSPHKPHPSTSPQKPPPSTSPQKPPPLTSPQKPPPPTSPHKPPPSTPFQKPPPSISPHKPHPSTSPHKLRPSTSIHKQPPSISSPKLPSSLSSQQSINLKSYTRGASFITYFYFILFILLYASPIFLNIVVNLKLNIFINNSIFLKFLFTIFRLEFFDIFLNRIFIFLLEYYDSYISFTYRKYLRT